MLFNDFSKHNLDTNVISYKLYFEKPKENILLHLPCSKGTMKTFVDPSNVVLNGMITYPENFQLINSMKTTSFFNLDKTEIGVKQSRCFNHMNKKFLCTNCQ